MFSLLMSILGIAIIAVITLATLYYGGDAMTKGKISARATAIINAGEQIMAANELFYLDNGRRPESLEALESNKYLSGIPKLSYDSGSFDLISHAHAAPEDGAGDWLYDRTVPHLAYIGEISMEICAEVNKQSSNRRVVLSLIDPNPLAQCVAKGAQDPVVVFRHSGDKLFDGWTDHPRIPAISTAGLIQKPVFDEGECLFGCDEEGNGAPPDTTPPEPEEPQGGLTVDFTGPPLTTYLGMTWDSYFVETAPYPRTLPYMVRTMESFDGIPKCEPILQEYTRSVDWTNWPEMFGSILINSQAHSRTDAGVALLSGITMTAKLVKVRIGNHGSDENPQPIHLAVMRNGNWEPYSEPDTVTSTFAQNLTLSDYIYPTTYAGTADDSYGKVLNGSIGFCAGNRNGSGPGNLDTYRIDMTFSRDGGTDSESMYILPSGS